MESMFFSKVIRHIKNFIWKEKTEKAIPWILLCRKIEKDDYTQLKVNKFNTFTKENFVNTFFSFDVLPNLVGILQSKRISFLFSADIGYDGIFRRNCMHNYDGNLQMLSQISHHVIFPQFCEFVMFCLNISDSYVINIIT